jgi:hypothetical protein
MMGNVLLYLRRHHVSYVALFIALGGTAYAATIPRNSVGSAQLKKDAVNSAKVRNGSLRTIDFLAGDRPKGLPGPAGPAGPQGIPGAPGPQGAHGERGPSAAYHSFFGDSTAAATSPTELAEQALPAGRFIAYANFIVRNTDADNAPHSFTCGLYYEGQAGNVASDNALDYAQVTMGAGAQHTVSLTGPVSQDSPGQITLTCYRGSSLSGGQVQVNDIDIGAVHVGALN